MWNVKRITHKTLMKKVKEGSAEVQAWCGEGSTVAFADVIFYGTSINNSPIRKTVEVTKIPAEFWA